MIAAAQDVGLLNINLDLQTPSVMKGFVKTETSDQ